MRVEAQLARAAAQSRLAPQPVGMQALDATQADGARFSASGRYDGTHQFFIDNRQQDGVPGLHVITPLKLDGSERVLLVNRGWIGWPHGRGTLPEAPPPPGQVQVTGVAHAPSNKAMFLMSERADPNPRLWPRLDLARYTEWARQPVQPVVLLQDADNAADGLVRRWPAPEDRSLKHRGYAFQWWAMAAALLVFHTVASLRRPAGTPR